MEAINWDAVAALLEAFGAIAVVTSSDVWRAAHQGSLGGTEGNISGVIPGVR